MTSFVFGFVAGWMVCQFVSIGLISWVAGCAFEHRWWQRLHSRNRASWDGRRHER